MHLGKTAWCWIRRHVFKQEGVINKSDLVIVARRVLGSYAIQMGEAICLCCGKKFKVYRSGFWGCPSDVSEWKRVTGVAAAAIDFLKAGEKRNR